MKILEIYERYPIPPILQEHMLRVAAVGKIICKKSKEPVDTRDVVLTCLLHDMGNIIKFDMKKFPEFIGSQGLERWQKVQKEYQAKYGDEHIATDAIVKELKVPEEVINLISLVGIRHSQENVELDNWNSKICCYSDMRVGPYGIISINQRVDDLKVRYKGKVLDKDNQIENWRMFLIKLEEQIFSRSNIKPEDVNDESIADIKESLKYFEI
jgi:hypothetical protein